MKAFKCNHNTERFDNKIDLEAYHLLECRNY